MRLNHEITEDDQQEIAQEFASIMRRKSKWEICGCCRGNGRVDNPAFSNGFTSQDWDDMRHDFDGESSAADRYMRGDYDVMCGECKGSGKMQAPDVSIMTFRERRVMVRYRHVLRIDAAVSREIAAEYAAERRMGC